MKRFDEFLRIASGRMNRRQVGVAGAMLLALLTGADPAVAHKRTRNAKRERPQSSHGANRGRPCGGIAGLPCPKGFVCVDDPRDDCDPETGGADCIGICVRKVKDPCATIRCRQGTRCCPKCGGICIPDDIRCSHKLCVNQPCNQAVCGPGEFCCNESCSICAPLGGACTDQFCEPGGLCGGIANIPCPDGFVCIDVPGDDCDPAAGGADCPGFCVPIGENPCAAILCLAGTTCCPQCGGICIPPNVPCSEDLCVFEPCNQAVCSPGEYCCNESCSRCVGLGQGCTREFCPPGPPPGEPCGHNRCGPGEYCCNESCGICAPLGGRCAAVVCDPEPGGLCGGIAGIPCPDGFECVDDPNDSCDPATGGADCSGICVPIDYNPCAAILCIEGTACCPQCGGICIPDGIPCSEDLCVSEPCNQVMCGPGEFCCNESCSICAPLGDGCVDQFCEPPSYGVPCGPTVCPVGQVCCNESCGICTPPGSVCILIACID